MRTYPDFPELWPRFGPQQYQAIAFTLAGLTAVALAWSFRINTNLFYVVFLSCSYVILQLLVAGCRYASGCSNFFTDDAGYLIDRRLYVYHDEDIIRYW